MARLGLDDLLTVRFGLIAHRTMAISNGVGDAVLTPASWQQWFSDVDVHGLRQSFTAVWDRAGLVAAGTHTLPVTAGIDLDHTECGDLVVLTSKGQQEAIFGLERARQ